MEQEVIQARMALYRSEEFKEMVNELLRNFGELSFLQKEVLATALGIQLIIGVYIDKHLSSKIISHIESIISSIDDKQVASSPSLLHAKAQVVMSKVLFITDEDEKLEQVDEHNHLLDSIFELDEGYSPALIDFAVAEVYRANEVGSPLDAAVAALTKAAKDERYVAEVNKYIEYLKIDMELS